MEQNDSFIPQVDLKVYGRIALRWAWLVILCAILAGGVAFLYSMNQTRIYSASSKVLVNEARNPATANYNDILLSERLARTYANLMQRDSTIEDTFVRLGLDPAAVRRQVVSVAVAPVRDTQLVQVTVESPNPELAAAMANTLPQVFAEGMRAVQLARFTESRNSLSTQLDELRKRIEANQLQMSDLQNQRTAQAELELASLRSEQTQLQASYGNLLNSFEQLRLTEAQSIDNIVLMEPAETPLSPVRPRTLVNALLAAVVGALLALGIVFLIEYLDDRVQSPDDLRKIADLPVLGAIAKMPGDKDAEDARSGNLIGLNEPRHPITEAYRRLRTNLQYANLDKEMRTLMVTSAEAGEGKSITSANLAVVMAQSGARVILVDADLRKPKQHTVFGVSKRPGLAEALKGGDIEALLCPVTSKGGNLSLWLLPAGDTIPNPAEVLGSHRMQQLGKQLLELADIVIYDTPPVLAVTDSQVMGRMVDGALLVIDTQKTGSAAVHRALESLLQVNTPLVGAVLNRLTSSARNYYYYYSYDAYYSDGDDDGKQRKGSRRRKQDRVVTPSKPAAEVTMAERTQTTN